MSSLSQFLHPPPSRSPSIPQSFESMFSALGGSSQSGGRGSSSAADFIERKKIRDRMTINEEEIPLEDAVQEKDMDAAAGIVRLPSEGELRAKGGSSLSFLEGALQKTGRGRELTKKQKRMKAKMKERGMQYEGRRERRVAKKSRRSKH